MSEQKMVMIRTSTGECLCGGVMNVNIYLHYVMKYTNWLECSVLAREIWEPLCNRSMCNKYVHTRAQHIYGRSSGRTTGRL